MTVRAKSPVSKPRKRPASKLSERVDAVLRELQTLNPNAHCELTYHTPYQLLISVVMSAQATDKSVNAAMEPLYANPFGPKDVMALGEQGFLEKIRRIGLAPTKAKNVLKLTKILLDQYDGEVPHTREELEALPGVGRKTANVILGEIFHQPTLAVDTHVYRVTSRLGFQKESTPEKAEHKLLALIESKWLPMAHHWFILHGRYTCTAKAPKCLECGIYNLCPFPQKTKK